MENNHPHLKKGNFVLYSFVVACATILTALIEPGGPLW